MLIIYDLVAEGGDFISSDIALLSTLLLPVGEVSIVILVVFVTLALPDFKGYSTDFVNVSRFDFWWSSALTPLDRDYI